MSSSLTTFMDKLAIAVDKKALISSFGETSRSSLYWNEIMTTCVFSPAKELSQRTEDKLEEYGGGFSRDE